MLEYGRSRSRNATPMTATNIFTQESVHHTVLSTTRHHGFRWQVGKPEDTVANRTLIDYVSDQIFKRHEGERQLRLLSDAYYVKVASKQYHRLCFVYPEQFLLHQDFDRNNNP